MEHSCSYKSKLSRRKKKYSSMLMDETGLQEVTKSKFLMVCNAGLVSGLEAETLVEVFGRYCCNIKNVIMIPGKSYCFVECTDEHEAEKAYSNVNGKSVIPEIKGPLHLLYTESVPKLNCNTNFNTKPNGLVVVDNFITETEEQMLLDDLRTEFLNPGNSLKHRLVKHYGYEFNYQTNNVNKNDSNCEPIPEKWKFIVERLHTVDKLKNWIPDQLTVNHYRPGQGIPFHVDTHSVFDDFILSLSLGSDIVMDFRNNEALRSSILLRRKCLLVMSGESRYCWCHGITPRKYDVIEGSTGLTTQTRGERISFTFRRLRTNNCCECSYPDYCDSRQEKENTFQIEETLASELESIHVHQVYDSIANHFSETRHKPWPNIEHFVKSFEIGSVFVDIGCGNGKYFGLNSSVYEIGCDRSGKLSEECHSRGFESVICDCLRLPYRSASADFCLCIAVIHHLSTKQRRVQAIEEIMRILRPSGHGLIYVWAKNQKQNDQLSSYLKQNQKSKSPIEDTAIRKTSHLVKLTANHNSSANEVSLPVHVNRTPFQQDDMLVPWKLKPRGKEGFEEVPTFLRYYHVFSEGELEALCESVSGTQIVKSYYDQGNWCVIAKKV